MGDQNSISEPDMSPKKTVQSAKPKAKKGAAGLKNQKPAVKTQPVRRVIAKTKGPVSDHKAQMESEDDAAAGAIVAAKDFRAQQSFFLMYLNAGKKAKNADRQTSCSELKDWYGEKQGRHWRC